MAVLGNLLSPISLAFLIIILGCFLGKINIRGISLDLSGVLIVAIICGCVFNEINITRKFINMVEFQTNLQFFSSIGTSLFVAVIGIITGYSLDVKRRNNIKAVGIGTLMVISSFVTMQIVLLVDNDISFSMLIGSMCGALTTTPGLAAASELKNIVTEEATIGYGCSYLFGVLATVFFVQIITRKSDDNSKNKNEIKKDYHEKNDFSEIMQIGITVLIGRLIGTVELFGISLGNSGGILCAGVVVGLVAKKYLPAQNVKEQTLNCFKKLGLILFFVGTGFPAGMTLSKGVDTKIIFYGAIMTIIPIVMGVAFNKILFKRENPATVVAGGMTSTPAIAILAQSNKHLDLTKYSLSYMGALITVTLLIRFVCGFN